MQNLSCTWERQRQALEGASLAPGSEATLNALRDPEKRPPFPRHPLPRELVYPEPEVEFDLDELRFARNLRSAKRGAAGGPSGMTVEHLQPLLGHPRDLRSFFRASEQLSRARVPHSIREAVRLGRLTALQEPNGSVRGIVAGDIVRRLVAHDVTTVDVRSPTRHTVPVRVGDEEWMREHRSRSARLDRVESAHHCHFHRRNKRVRFDIASGQVGWDEAHCSGIGITVRVHVLWASLKLFVGRRSWQGSHHFAGRRWRTGRRNDALVVLIRPTPGIAEGPVTIA